MMKKSFRRGAALLLTFAMLLGMTCVPVSADTQTAATDDYTVKIGDVDWNFDSMDCLQDCSVTCKDEKNMGKNFKYPLVVETAPGSDHGNALKIRLEKQDRNQGPDGFIMTPYKYVNKNNATSYKDGVLSDTEAVPYQKTKICVDFYFEECVSATFILWGNKDESSFTQQNLLSFSDAGFYYFASGGTQHKYEAKKWYHFEICVDTVTGEFTLVATDGENTVTATEMRENVENEFRYCLTLRLTYNCVENGSGKVFWTDNWKWYRLDDLKSTDAASEQVTTGFPVLGGEVAYNFSHDMAATQPETVKATFSDGNATVDGTISVNGKTISVAPKDALDFDTEYTVTLSAGVKDKYGRATSEAVSAKVKTPAKTDVYSEAVAVDTESDNVSASTKVSNFKTGTGSAALIIAKYDASGNLIDCDIAKNTNIAQDGTANLNASLSKPGDGETVYVYAVDGETLSKPLNPTAWKITSTGTEEMLNDCTPTAVTLNPLEISDKGEIKVSGSVEPKQKTLVYINVQGPKASAAAASDIALYANEADEETEPSALIPVLTNANGEFELKYTPENFVSGKYTATVGGWQSESQSSSAFCIDEDTRTAILKAVNGAADAEAMKTALTADYRKLLNDDSEAFCDNAFQTLVEQKPAGGYTSVSDVTKMINDAKSLLANVNKATADELMAMPDATANIVLYGQSYLSDLKNLSDNNKKGVFGCLPTDTTYADFTEFRTAMATAWAKHLAVTNGVNKATTADEVKAVLDAQRPLPGATDTDTALFCDNAYQTLLEQKSYQGIADVVLTMEKAKSLLAKVNATNYAELTPVLTDAENKKMLFFGYAAIDTFANSDSTVQTQVCSYMVPDMPFATFAALRTSLTNAMKKYNDSLASIDEELSGNQSGLTGTGGGRPSVSGSSKGSVSGVLPIGGATTDPTPIATPVATPSTTVETPFADMKDAAWASEYVASLAAKGIVSGDANGNFRPNDAVTREEFVKLLVGALGIEVGEAGESFADADVNAWYAKYLAAAKAAGIITGNEDGTFGVGNEITRQDMAVMAVRAVNAIGKTLPSGGATFTDSDSISSYAAQAVGQMQAAGILNGIGNGTFAPMDSTSRAASAKVIDSLMNLVIGK